MLGVFIKGWSELKSVQKLPSRICLWLLPNGIVGVCQITHNALRIGGKRESAITPPLTLLEIVGLFVEAQRGFPGYGFARRECP